MTDFSELYSVESIPALRSYVENQGDKFHPLSDELREALEAPVSSQEELLGTLLTALDSYEARPASIYHLYHTAQLRARLAPEPDWDQD